MDTLFLEAPYTGKIELCSETLDYLKEKGYKKVGLYASVQFVGNLKEVEKQLQNIEVKWVSSHADRTDVVRQLLGCDSYHDSLNLDEEIDSYLYVGDGKFHPLALVYGQKDVDHEKVKEIICNDPMANEMNLLGFDEIRVILKKYKGSLIKFLSSKTVGLLHTIKPGQEQFRPSLKLEEMYPEKEFYHFIDNVVSFDQLENFNFIEVWINTTCPRVGFDDQEKFRKGVVNVTDALNAEKVLSSNGVLNS